MSDGGYITAEMLAGIGQPFGAAESYPVSRSDIRRWAIATYYPEIPPRIYWDEDFALTGPHAGIVAPEEFNPFAWASLRPDLSTRTGELDFDYVEHQLGITGPGLATNLNAGLATEYGARMRPGDVIRTTSHVLSYEEKSGRMGRMLLTVIRTVWLNQRDELVRQTDQTSIRY